MHECIHWGKNHSFKIEDIHIKQVEQNKMERTLRQQGSIRTIKDCLWSKGRNQ